MIGILFFKARLEIYVPKIFDVMRSHSQSDINLDIHPMIKNLKNDTIDLALFFLIFIFTVSTLKKLKDRCLCDKN